MSYRCGQINIRKQQQQQKQQYKIEIEERKREGHRMSDILFKDLRRNTIF
jgi:hypothetical protein